MAMSDGFWLGVLGGLLAEVFSLSKLRYLAKNELPLWLTSVWYWLITTLLIVSGGVFGRHLPRIRRRHDAASRREHWRFSPADPPVARVAGPGDRPGADQLKRR